LIGALLPAGHQARSPRQRGAAPWFRTIVPGRETLPRGYDLPRHRHLEPYALVVIAGAFEQTSYAGRVVATAGDLLVQPTLDCHANRLLSGGATILRLPWIHVEGPGGVYRLRDLDGIVRLAARDVHAASAAVRAEVAGRDPLAAAQADWPDLLALDIRRGRVRRLSEWAEAHGLAVATLSRGFARVYGVVPARFRGEWRARGAWLKVVGTADGLARIAAAAGFADQAHMTRSIIELTGAPPSYWRRQAGGANRLPSPGVDAR
jgi:AraC-like DNA-binding protein